MDYLGALRDRTAAFIAQDPVQVTITRTTSQEDGYGGWVGVETTLGPFACRLYPRRTDDTRDVTEGTARQTDAWGAMFPHDADVAAGDGVEDVIETPDGRKFRVRAVLRRTWEGAVYAIQADCEEVR